MTFYPFVASQPIKEKYISFKRINLISKIKLCDTDPINLVLHTVSRKLA